MDEMIYCISCGDEMGTMPDTEAICDHCRWLDSHFPDADNEG